jgi:hypothetical protein
MRKKAYDDICKLWVPSKDDEFVLIPTEWLRQWISGEKETKPTNLGTHKCYFVYLTVHLYIYIEI